MGLREQAERYRGVQWGDGQPATVVRNGKRSGAPDPRSLRTVDGPPPEPAKPPRSAWWRVYESLTPGGDGKVMTREQAAAFASWARAHKLRITRRAINGIECGVWRPAEE